MVRGLALYHWIPASQLLERRGRDYYLALLSRCAFQCGCAVMAGAYRAAKEKPGEIPGFSLLGYGYAAAASWVLPAISASAVSQSSSSCPSPRPRVSYSS